MSEKFGGANYLSIVVPIYNVEKYLRQCLESVYRLNLKKEVILVVDGSPDNSLLIAREFAEKYPEETALIVQENQGLSEARNVGLRIATGEYIYFLDSDDFIDTVLFEQFFAKIQGSNIDILHGNAIKYTSDLEKEILVNLHFKGIKALSGKEFIKLSYKKRSYFPVVWLNIYRKEYLLENHFFFKKGIVYEDMLFSLPVFFAAKSVVWTSDCFYYYRQHEGSITHGKKNFKDMKYVLLSNCQFILEHKIFYKGVIQKMSSQVRHCMLHQGKVDEELYQILLSLPCHSWISIRNLIDLSVKRYFFKLRLKKIKEELKMK